MTTISLKIIQRKRPNGQPKPVWQLRWFDGNGQHRGKTIGDCAKVSKREAEAIRRDHQSKVDCGVIKADPPARHTLAEYAVYDREAIADRAEKTVKSYGEAVQHATKALGSSIRMKDIGRREVAKVKRHLQDQDLKPATIDKVLRTLRAFFNRALRDGAIHENPFIGERVRWDPKDSRIFTAAEIDAMIAVAPNDWWRAFLRLMTTTGLRHNEGMHLRWDHIDLDRGVVRVARQDAGRFEVDSRSYPLLAWRAKAKSSYREIPVPTTTTDELRRWKAKAGKSAYVFVSLDRLRLIDVRLRAGTMRSDYELEPYVLGHFKRIQRDARARLAKTQGVEAEEVRWRIGTLHDLRDTYLTNIKGVSVDVLKRIAGHSSIATTLKYYTNPTERDAEDVLGALAASGIGKPEPSQGTLRAHPENRSAG